MAEPLPQWSFVGPVKGTLKSCNSCLSQMTSVLAEVNTLCSASMEERTTIDCFLVLQEINVVPRNEQYPEVDLSLLVSLA